MLAEIEDRQIRVGDELLPLTFATCRTLRAQHGSSLVIGPELHSWAITARQASATERYSPHLAAAMAQRPYQIVGAARIAEHRSIAVLDEGGLGKSAQVLSGLMESGTWRGRHLVLCPKTAVTSTWKRQIEAWSDGQFFAMVGTRATKAKAFAEFMAAESGARFLVMNPENLRTKIDGYCKRCERWEKSAPKIVPAMHDGREDHKAKLQVYSHEWPEIFDVEWDSVIADEADRYMLGLRPQIGKSGTLVGEGLKRLQARQRIPMTGTPFRGKEHNIFGLLHWIDPLQFKGFWPFINRYFDTIVNDFGTEIGGIRPDAEARFGKMLDRYTLRRTRAEVRSDLPDNLDIVHWVDMVPEHRKQYEAFVEQGFVRMGADVLQGQGVLSELTRCKQMAFGSFDYDGEHLTPRVSPKFDLVLDMLAERGVTQKGPTFGTMKFIVASQFTDQLQWMQTRLDAVGIQSLRIDGSVTGRRRDAAVDDFSSEGGPRVLFLNTMVASSITLDAWCDEMFILDETFVEDDQNQLRWRIDNRGDRVAVRVYHYLRTANTIDQTIAEDNLSQAAMQDALLDGRRGIEVAKRLIGRTS